MSFEEESIDSGANPAPENPVLAEGSVAASAPEPVPSTTPVDEPAPASVDAGNYVTLIFRDGLDMPIPGLELFVTLPSGEVCTAKSTDQGAMTLPVAESAGGSAQVEVKDATGKRQPICSLDLSKCTDAVIIRSPKVKVALPLREHQQTPPPSGKKMAAKPEVSKPDAAKGKPKTEPAHTDTSSAWWGANGALNQAWTWLTNTLHLNEHAPTAVTKTPTVAKTVSNAGQPVTVIVGPEGPNKDNLRLGRNNVYRRAILDAAKRLGLIPQALCALMDCEAGKVTEHVPMLGPDGKQLKDKKGKPRTTPLRELWNANAGNPQSGAAGLTQFLASTWLGHVLIPGFYIHTQSVANGWVRKEVDPKGKSYWAFVLADGKSTTKPCSMKSDANVKKCLAMRMDATWSINAAADYGNANLKLLEKRGFKLGGLNDMERAKLMYLMHHEGEGAGPLFIRNTLATAKGGTEGLRKKFATQLGTSGGAKAKEHVDAAGGDVQKAYRRWLAKYIDKQFNMAQKYFCQSPMAMDELSELMDSVGGAPL